MIPQAFVQNLLDRIDITDIVGRYVQLKRAGANLSGLCPFHREKTPSFSVSPAKQFYHCFGCGAHGTALSFVMEHLGLSFPDAVEQLASEVGLKVPQENDPKPDNLQKSQQILLSDRMQAAQGFYQSSLRRYPQAIEYLKGRGLTGQLAKKFGLGFAPSGYQALATVFADYQHTQDLLDCGLVIASQPEENKPAHRYDRFRERIMFPIRNVRGQTIGFGGRVMGVGEPKYLNSPETPLFSKGQELYGLFEARTAIRSQGAVIVTEGYMDVLALVQWGFENTVATLGTALTAQHIQKLFRQTQRVVFSFDGDNAGRKAAWRALEASLPYAGDQRRIEFLFLPAQHDPDSYIREQGAQAFAMALEGAMPLSAYLMQEVAKQHPLGQVEGRAAAIAMLRPLVGQIPVGAYRLALVKTLAQQLDVTPAELEQQLGLLVKGQQSSAHSPGKKSRLGQARAVSRANLHDAEQRLAAVLLNAPQWAALCADLKLCFASSMAQLTVSRRSLVVVLDALFMQNQGKASVAGLLEHFRGTVHEVWVDAAMRLSLTLDSQLDSEAEVVSLVYQCLDGWLNDEIHAVVATGLKDQTMRDYYRDLNEKRLNLKQIRVSTV